MVFDFLDKTVCPASALFCKVLSNSLLLRIVHGVPLIEICSGIWFFQAFMSNNLNWIVCPLTSLQILNRPKFWVCLASPQASEVLRFVEPFQIEITPTTFEICTTIFYSKSKGDCDYHSKILLNLVYNFMLQLSKGWILCEYSRRGIHWMVV